MDSPAGPLPPEDAEEMPIPSTLPDRRALVTQGLVWTGLLQVFLVGANFVSMIILVRLLPPTEYGRAAAATGVLALINCFNCSYFIAQALQLHEGEEPDFSGHPDVGSKRANVTPRSRSGNSRTAARAPFTFVKLFTTKDTRDTKVQISKSFTHRDPSSRPPDPDPAHSSRTPRHRRSP